MADHTKPSETTRNEEAKEARTGHDAGREATPEEAAAADKNQVNPETKRTYDEMLERGAHQEGEGKPGL